MLLLAAAVGCHAPEKVEPRGDEALASRAGHPQEVSCRAGPSDTGAYVGYQVGGGATSRRKGEAPAADEGTWGWDYEGCWWPSRVMLGWWHGKRYQGGLEGYKTDGPRPIKKIEERHEE